MVFIGFNASAEQKGRGGSFTEGADNLKKISSELRVAIMGISDDQMARLLEFLESLGRPGIALKDKEIPYLDPRNLRKQDLAGLLEFENIDLRPNENTEDAERYFFWAFNPKSSNFNLIALKPFFEKHGLMPIEKMRLSDISEVRVNLLKECSHIWGFDDAQGKAFAEKVLSILHFRNHSLEGCYKRYEKAVADSEGRAMETFMWIKNIIKEAKVSRMGSKLLEWKKDYSAKYFWWQNMTGSCKLGDAKWSINPEKLDIGVIADAVNIADESGSLCADDQTVFRDEFDNIIEEFLKQLLSDRC